MRNKLGAILFIAALMLMVAPPAAQPGSSLQKGGVAGGGRVARGNARDSRAAESTHSHVERATSEEDESTPRVSSRRIREIESLEQQCLDEINRVRRRSGLPRLNFYEDLLPVAREYSRRMAEERFFSHNDPDGRTVRERVDDADIRWRMVGENLAYSNGYINPVAASLHGWMESPGHRRNILDPDFKLTAIGVWIRSDGTVYFTEIFLKQ
ncbi:MAG: CAP domain-containing protein [Acidobacteriota bacterium]